jgi:preprotein translocase subunit SecD
MKRKEWLRFGAILAVLFAALGLLYPFWPVGEVVKLGLDLQGGVRLVLQAQGVEEMSAEERADTVERLVTILQERVDQYGLANVEIRPLGENRIEIKIPGAQDPQQARQLIGRTALLEFRKVIRSAENPDELVPDDPTQEILANPDQTRYYLVEGDPLLTGDVLDNAYPDISTDPSRPGHYIGLVFNQDGAQRFVEALRQLDVGDQLAIVLDGVVYSAPAVSQEIKDTARREGWRGVREGTVISGIRTFEEARLLAVVLRSGALPVEVTVLEEATVGPTLGSDSIRRGTMAILISFILVLLYMPTYYRWLGLVADAALILNMLIVFSALRAFGATLTLPGIAGLILTIGMTVDANVIIFERIKEERRTGKAPRACIVSGFSKSMSAILDANLTTLITAVILFSLGSGPVEGFAITLALGVVGSLFCALVASRFLLESTGLGERIPVKVPSSG